jgi:hypothetical protein
MKFDKKDIEFKDGFGTVEVGSWRKFTDFINDNSKHLKGYIFRGQPQSSFKLEPTFLRSYKGRPKKYHESLRRQLRRFRLNLRGRISLTDREAGSENEIWALGQHNGLATPLLDWTASPLAAAFFAFVERRPNPMPKERRTVFALHARKVNRAFYNKVQEYFDDNKDDRLEQFTEYVEDDWSDGQGFPERVVERLYPVDSDTYMECCLAVGEAELKVPRIISPLSGENKRLVNQRGLFTKYGVQEPLEEWVQRHCAGKNEPILLKVNLPESQRDEALRLLDAANINYLSLFPDIYGAAHYANSKMPA